LREFVEEFAGIMNMQLDLRKEAVRKRPHHQPRSFMMPQSAKCGNWC
jgi:hypothetical protein